MDSQSTIILLSSENNVVGRRHSLMLFQMKYTYQVTYFVKWICLQSTIAVSHAHWTLKSYNSILIVVFLFQSFLIITKVYY